MSLNIKQTGRKKEKNNDVQRLVHHPHDTKSDNHFAINLIILSTILPDSISEVLAKN
jgi:hypothetical protein